MGFVGGIISIIPVVLVTNDEDFLEFNKEQIFSVIWLKIPQEKPEPLLNAFSKLVKEKPSPEDFEGNLVVLGEEDFEISPIPSSTKV